MQKRTRSAVTMEPLSPLAAYDVLRFAETFVPRLARAREQLAGRSDLMDERRWLSGILETMEREVEAVPSALEAARMLPDLVEVRGDFAAERQGKWVDAVEKLYAG